MIKTTWLLLVGRRRRDRFLGAELWDYLGFADGFMLNYFYAMNFILIIDIVADVYALVVKKTCGRSLGL